MKDEKRIYALGFFDGVHLGHQALLSECCRLTRELDARAAAITFDKHPQSLFTDEPPRLINTEADRQRLLRQYGIGSIYLLPVVKEVMSTPWQAFVNQLLESGAAGFVCGDDFRFGNRGEGSAEKLYDSCQQAGIPCVVVPEQKIDGIRVSSSYIRTLLEYGDMERAAKFLGHPHILSGTVVRGRRLGHTLGFPTANLRFPDTLIQPKFGVYACLALVDGARCPAVTNIGTRPTVGGSHVTVEPWLLDFQGDLYGKEITLEFYRFLRPEKKFGSIAELQAEIRKNAAETLDFFGKN